MVESLCATITTVLLPLMLSILSFTLFCDKLSKFLKFNLAQTIYKFIFLLYNILTAKVEEQNCSLFKAL